MQRRESGRCPTPRASATRRSSTCIFANARCSSGSSPWSGARQRRNTTPSNQQQGFRGRDRRRLCPSSEPAAEGLSWTQPRDKPGSASSGSRLARHSARMIRRPSLQNGQSPGSKPKKRRRASTRDSHPAVRGGAADPLRGSRASGRAVVDHLLGAVEGAADVDVPSGVSTTTWRSTARSMRSTSSSPSTSALRSWSASRSLVTRIAVP